MKKYTIAREVSLDLAADIACGFLQGIGLHCFIDSIDTAPGGATGLAILLNRLISVPIGFATLMINIPLLISSWVFLGKQKTLRTLKTVLILTLILDLIVTPYIPVYSGDKMLSCLFGGILVGASLAVAFLRGSTTGGGDIMAKLLQKFRPHMQTGFAVMLTDLIIIGASMLVFRNIESGLYGLITMTVSSYVIDLLLYGQNRSTMITVISPRSREIAAELMDKLGHGCTMLKSRGAYSGAEGETVICVMDRKQFYRAKKIVYGIDADAFVIVSEAKEVYGEGFLASDWEV